MSEVKSGKMEFVCTFAPVAKRALGTAPTLEVLQMGAIRAWMILLAESEATVLDAIEDGEVAHMSQSEDGHQLVAYEYEAGKEVGEVLAFMRTHVTEPVTSLLLGVLKREAKGPNDYVWRMYQLNVTVEK